MQIRKMKESDINGVVEILVDEFSKKPYNEKWGKRQAFVRVKTLWRGAPEYCLVCIENNRVVGMLLSETYDYFDGKRCWITDFAVIGESQGRGYGMKLLEKLEEKLVKKKFAKILFESHLKSSATGFYKKKGYKKNGFIIMEKNLK
ncbi:MAG: GNAT family N-acetyltransferase [Candidatus Diapherotrites archaeon]